MNQVILCNFIAGKLGDRLSFVHDHDPVAQTHNLREFRGNHNHAHSVIAELPQHTVDLILGAHVNTAGGLIQNNDFRVHGEELGYHDLLLIAAGQIPHRLADAA